VKSLPEKRIEWLQRLQTIPSIVAIGHDINDITRSIAESKAKAPTNPTIFRNHHSASLMGNICLPEPRNFGKSVNDNKITTMLISHYKSSYIIINPVFIMENHG
jgi:hypothetical protein